MLFCNTHLLLLNFIDGISELPCTVVFHKQMERVCLCISKLLPIFWYGKKCTKSKTMGYSLMVLFCNTHLFLFYFIDDISELRNKNKEKHAWRDACVIQYAWRRQTKKAKFYYHHYVSHVSKETISKLFTCVKAAQPLESCDGDGESSVK